MTSESPRVGRYHVNLGTGAMHLHPEPILADAGFAVLDSLTPAEFKAKMVEICSRESSYRKGYHDAEQAHGEADELMVELLRSLGYGEGVDIFWNSTRWYA